MARKFSSGVGGLMQIDFSINKLSHPAYLVDETLLKYNLEILKQVAEESGCKILLAQKAFSMFYFYPLIGKYLDGVTACGLYEARLGKEEMQKENHIFSPMYEEEDFPEILDICDHIIFNSLGQWTKFKKFARASQKSFGLRINPEHSTQDHAIYDPCSANSRLGIKKEQLKKIDHISLEGIDGFHFHCLCEQNADALIETWNVFEDHFSSYFSHLKWLNLGGGHHITRPDYDKGTLIDLIGYIRQKYNIAVYIEPGEAIAFNAGYLVCSVIDIIHNDIDIAILDISAACHMPDVLEVPYRPPLLGSGLSMEKPFTYLLGGPSCLAGDIIGTYSFENRLQIKDKLIFGDMAHYSMVKNNHFNGMKLPNIGVITEDRQINIIKHFTYHDFKNRLS